MATGDSADILGRVKSLIPKRWFSWVAPGRDAIVGGLSDGAAKAYSLITYARTQTRMKTMQAPWLDLTSYDFLGTTLPRRANESDLAYSARIVKEVLRARNTRAAIVQMLQDLTGIAGVVQEPWNPRDWGGYGLPYSGYGIALGYGSLSFRNQVFVKAFRAVSSGIPVVPGYGSVPWGYGSGNGPGCYCDLSQVQGPVTDAEIYSRITQTISAGTTAWVAIVNAGTNYSAGSLVFTGGQTLAMEAALGFFW